MSVLYPLVVLPKQRQEQRLERGELGGWERSEGFSQRGEADRIADPDYGRALAATIGGWIAAELALLVPARVAGRHLAQMETPAELAEVISGFAAELAVAA
jgi:hypothetical protein